MHDVCQEVSVGYKVVSGSYSEVKGPCKEQGTVVNGRVEKDSGD